MTISFLIGFLLITCFVLYFTHRLTVWSLAILVYLMIVHYMFLVNSIVFTIVCTIYAVIAIVFNVKLLRRFVITNFLFSKAQAIFPKVSDTEQLALRAGDAWYEKEIFQGNPNFKLLHSLKPFGLSDEESSFMKNEATTLCSMIDDWKITYIDKDLPVEMWDYLREKGFFGLVIAKEFGGKGFSACAHSEIVMKLATRSISVAVTVMVPNSLGPGELLLHYGTDEQKNYYLPRLARGEDIPCFALTGPTAGSDATSIPDEGVVCMGQYNGQQVLGIRLKNVHKHYITLAPIATLVGLAFKLKDPDDLLNGVGKSGITCALLPYDHPGLEIGNRLLPLDQAFMNGTVRIKESFIPIDWIIGGQKMAGEGWRMLVECLSIGRSISLPACGTASSLVASVLTSAYAFIREQFNVPISSFEGVEEKLAATAGIAYMLNATRQFTVSSVDAGIRPSVASAITKYHLTEYGRVAMNNAMDIHAGRGIIMGPHNYLARGYEGSPIGITVEGSNIMTRNLLIFGQGAIRCHPFLLKEYESVRDKLGIVNFDKAIFGHIGYIMHNKICAIFHAFSCGFFAEGYTSKFKHYYKQITRLSSALAYISDVVLITIGGDIKKQERMSARLGDTMSYLYMACASLKYYEANGRRASDDLFLRWTLDHCLHNAQTALVETLDNFKMKVFGKILKFFLFPYGKPFKKPSDQLEHELSVSILSDSETRQVFKSMCYIPYDTNDPMGRVEVAFKAALESYPIKVKVQMAIRKHQLPKLPVAQVMGKALELDIIDKAEYDKLMHSIKLTDEIMLVDDEFSPFELGKKNAHPLWS